MRTIAIWAIVVGSFALDGAEARGLFRKCAACQNTGVQASRLNAAAGPGENIASPKAVTPAPGAVVSPLSTAPDHHDEIVKRINAWKAAAVVDSPAQQIKLLIGGKEVILEFRVLGGGAVTPPIDPNLGGLSKNLAAALTLDAPNDITRVAGLKSLAGNYANLADAINADKVNYDTIENMFSFRDKALRNQKSAMTLTKTQTAIQAYLDAQLIGLDRKTAMSDDTRAKLTKAFQDVAKAVEALR